MLRDLTFLIKTFQRKKSLVRLLDSIEKYFPGQKIIIVDDSLFRSIGNRKIKSYDLDITYIKTRFDIGASAGRNLLVENVNTENFLLFDDDFEVTTNSNIVKNYNDFISMNIDVLGGSYMDVSNESKVRRKYHGKLVKESDVLYLKDVPSNQQYTNCDIVLDFFFAKRSVFSRHKWCEALKTCEHLEFFYRLSKHDVSIMYSSTLNIDHHYTMNRFYFRYRIARSKKYIDLAKTIMGVKTVFIYDDYQF